MTHIKNLTIEEMAELHNEGKAEEQKNLEDIKFREKYKIT